MKTARQGLFAALGRIRAIASDLGWLTTLRYLLCKFGPVRIARIKVRHKHAQFPLWIRVRSSDADLFREIFCDHDFSCIDDLQNPGLILDCGANVGYTAAYFLSRFPTAFVIAVEPDAGNFALLQANLAPYAGRCTLINSAIWSRRTGLRLSEVPFRDGREWSVSVREAQPGEPAQMQAVTLNEIVAESKFDRISLLKIDIEGAEKEVLSGALEPWLSKTDVLTIELHDAECYGLFETAVASQHFTISRSGELTVCKRT
jgi:FkbM family methyltransferase